MKLLELADGLRLRREYGMFEDFLWYISPHLWTSLAADAGVTAPAVSASVAGGVVSMATGATDNNEVAVATTNKPFKFADDAPLVFEARTQFSEANTDDANVFLGFSSALAADQLVDNGAGPAANFSGIGVFKVDSGANGTKWQFVTSIGTTQTITVSQHTAGGAAYQVLRVEARAVGSAYVECVPWLNGQQMLDANGRPIKHTVDSTSAAAMAAGAYLKAGGANSETLLTDYVAAYQLRT